MELPAGLSMMFIGIFFPQLCLVLITVRFTLFLEAAREAGDVASSAQTYMDTTVSYGAITQARNKVISVSNMFPGITINPDTGVNCYVVTTPLGSTSAASVVTGPNTALNTAVDPSTNLYQIRIDITGQISPVVNFPSNIFGNVPGLTSPFPVTTSVIRVLENPQGLFQPGPGAN